MDRCTGDLRESHINNIYHDFWAYIRIYEASLWSNCSSIAFKLYVIYHSKTFALLSIMQKTTF